MLDNAVAPATTLGAVVVVVVVARRCRRRLVSTTTMATKGKDTTSVGWTLGSACRDTNAVLVVQLPLGLSMFGVDSDTNKHECCCLASLGGWTSAVTATSCGPTKSNDRATQSVDERGILRCFWFARCPILNEDDGKEWHSNPLLHLTTSPCCGVAGLHPLHREREPDASFSMSSRKT